KSKFDRDNNLAPGEVKTEVGADNKPRLPLVKITDVIGRDVRNQQKEDFGKIEDLAIDVGNRDKIVFAVLSTGGFLGMGEKLVALPFNLVNLNRADKAVVVRLDRDKIKNAPTFERKD